MERATIAFAARLVTNGLNVIRGRLNNRSRSNETSEDEVQSDEKDENIRQVVKMELAEVKVIRTSSVAEGGDPWDGLVSFEVLSS
jgi:hypothetical protein